MLSSGGEGGSSLETDDKQSRLQTIFVTLSVMRVLVHFELHSMMSDGTWAAVRLHATAKTSLKKVNAVYHFLFSICIVYFSWVCT